MDLTQIKKKTRAYEMVGVRVSEELKDALNRFCKDNSVTISGVISLLIKDLLKSKGYIDSK